MPHVFIKSYFTNPHLKKKATLSSQVAFPIVFLEQTPGRTGVLVLNVVKMYCRYTKNANAVKYILNLKTTQFVPSRRDHQNLFSSVQASIIMMANRKMDTPVKYN